MGLTSQVTRSAANATAHVQCENHLELIYELRCSLLSWRQQRGKDRSTSQMSPLKFELTTGETARNSSKPNTGTDNLLTWRRHLTQPMEERRRRDKFDLEPGLFALSNNSSLLALFYRLLHGKLWLVSLWDIPLPQMIFTARFC